MSAVEAAAALARRSGATEFRVTAPGAIGGVQRYFATATFASGNQVQGDGPNPFVACDRLAVRLLDGAVCRRCNHVIAVTGNDPTYCQWRRYGDEWRAGCGMPIDRLAAVDVEARY